MEPRIQYAKTSDGVSIAYWTLGKGPVLILPPILFASHVQLDWNVTPRRQAYEFLARRSTVVRYDCRGLGMSDREPVDFTREAALRDLNAVVERLELERFAIMGSPAISMGVVGFDYALLHPDAVSHLVYRVPMVAMADATSSAIPQRLRLLDSFIEEDWEMYTEVVARILGGWSAPHISELAELIRASHTPASYRLIADGMLGGEVLPPMVDASTLVLHGIGNEREAAIARRVAAGMPHAHVVGIPADRSPYAGEVGLKAILDFITSDATGVPPSIDLSAVRTVLFTDLVGHAEMMARLGDDRGRDVLREHETITRDVLKQYGGTEVKTMGDGFMASFGSVTKAVECAVVLQRAFSDREGEPLSVRVGLNAGEPIEEDGDLFGSTVILASRIAAKAEGGEILVADTVRGLCSGKGFLFADRGEFAAKGFEEPVRVSEVSWRHTAAS